jgi:hypothetical protein
MDPFDESEATTMNAAWDCLTYPQNAHDHSLSLSLLNKWGVYGANDLKALNKPEFERIGRFLFPAAKQTFLSCSGIRNTVMLAGNEVDIPSKGKKRVKSEELEDRKRQRVASPQIIDEMYDSEKNVALRLAQSNDSGDEDHHAVVYESAVATVKEQTQHCLRRKSFLCSILNDLHNQKRLPKEKQNFWFLSKKGDHTHVDYNDFEVIDAKVRAGSNIQWFLKGSWEAYVTKAEKNSSTTVNLFMPDYCQSGMEFCHDSEVPVRRNCCR